MLMDKDEREEIWTDLLARAWATRERSSAKTRVGCAVVAANGIVAAGCNIEHRFRSHDIHAEVSALAAMVSAGGDTVVKLAIAAERDFFVPCGSCLDWIFELGGKECEVAFQPARDGIVIIYTAEELMPHYPT